MEKKRIYRSANDKMIGGVCGGFGEYFNIDSTIIRILFLLFLFIGGCSIIIYLISLIIIPLNPEYKSEEKKKNNTNLSLFIGSSFILFGFLLLLSNFGLRPFHFLHFSWDIILSVFLIVLGFFLIFKPNKIMKNYETGRETLKKSSSDKMIFGVCSGIARHLNVDPTFIRLFWVFFTFASFGISIILYLTLALVLPNDRYIQKEI